MDRNIYLDPEKIIQTIERLEKRITDRFPESGLRQLCGDFLATAKKSQENIQWIATPNVTLRILTAAIILIGIAGLIFSITFIDLEIENTSFENFVTLSEAAVNDLVLIGAAIYFLISIESRVKQNRAVKALNDLRALAHVVDMHQLTKDPNIIGGAQLNTQNSPSRTLSKFELQRYLDYCSEFTALIAKVAALYVQSLPDEGVVHSVNEVEQLCNSLSRKIWQKLIILNELDHQYMHLQVPNQDNEDNEEATQQDKKT